MILTNVSDWWRDLWSGIGKWFMEPDAEKSGIRNLDRIIFAILALIIGHFLIKFLIWLIKKAFHLPRKLSVDVSVRSFAISVINVALNLVLAVFVLWLLNVDMVSVAGVLSAITVAVGLALQDVISSFASGVILLNAKYFVTGDYIAIEHSSGKAEGTVVRVQILSTSLKTPAGQTIIIPNGKINSGVIINYTKNARRRLDLSVRIALNNDIEKVKRVALQVLKDDERILLEPEPTVFIDELGEYHLSVHLRGWIKHQTYWDVRNEINEEILLAFQRESIAFPGRRILIEESKTLSQDSGEKDRKD